MKLNPTFAIETVEVRLTPEKYPIAYQNKLDELMEQGAFDTKEEAEKWIRESTFVLELYYQKHHGLFAVESDALESAFETMSSPYNGEAFEEEQGYEKEH